MGSGGLFPGGFAIIAAASCVVVRVESSSAAAAAAAVEDADIAAAAAALLLLAAVPLPLVILRKGKCRAGSPASSSAPEGMTNKPPARECVRDWGVFVCVRV